MLGYWRSLITEIATERVAFGNIGGGLGTGNKHSLEKPAIPRLRPPNVPILGTGDKLQRPVSAVECPLWVESGHYGPHELLQARGRLWRTRFHDVLPS